MSKENAVKSLIAALEGRDWAARKEAMKGLVDVGRPAVKPLIVALQEGNAELRHMAALILGKLGDRSAVPALVKAMSDEDQRVRANVALSLGELGGDKAVDALIAALGDEAWWVRSCVADALGWSGGSRAVGPLIEALKREDRLAEERTSRPSGKQARPVERFSGGLGEGDIVREYAVQHTILRSLNHIGTREALAAVREYGG